DVLRAGIRAAPVREAAVLAQPGGAERAGRLGRRARRRRGEAVRSRERPARARVALPPRAAHARARAERSPHRRRRVVARGDGWRPGGALRRRAARAAENAVPRLRRAAALAAGGARGGRQLLAPN